MRDRPFVRREGTGFSVRFAGAQRPLLQGALLWLAHRREGEPALTVWAGCGRQRLERLAEMLDAGEQTLLTVADLHVLHAVLLSVPSMFASEEAFHTQLGFYRENALALAGGLVRAVQEAAGSEG
ncbi:hypothetical protein ACIRJM_42300 [Streptomyces sp. NPDC102405]|uniref:hypothetical protein n=1 Tax=Streptomyces sp. NPDC102405 TaxID=3366170 RepID=UPI003801B1E6